MTWCVHVYIRSAQDLMFWQPTTPVTAELYEQPAVVSTPWKYAEHTGSVGTMASDNGTWVSAFTSCYFSGGNWVGIFSGFAYTKIPFNLAQMLLCTQRSAQTRRRKNTWQGIQYPVLTTNNTYKGTLCSNGKRQAPGITITTELFVPFSDAAVSKVIE